MHDKYRQIRVWILDSTVQAPAQNTCVVREFHHQLLFLLHGGKVSRRALVLILKEQIILRGQLNSNCSWGPGIARYENFCPDRLERADILGPLVTFLHANLKRALAIVHKPKSATDARIQHSKRTVVCGAQVGDGVSCRGRRMPSGCLCSRCSQVRRRQTAISGCCHGYYRARVLRRFGTRGRFCRRCPFSCSLLYSKTARNHKRLEFLGSVQTA